MRTSAIVFSTVLLMAFANASRADVVITEMFHVDPGWEAGGYWELTVSNLSGRDLYLVTVGNVDADVVAVRPDLVGIWGKRTVLPESWDSGDWGHFGTEFTFPDTSTMPFATYFPGATQVLAYYVLGFNPPIANGSVFTGLYFNYPIEVRASASRRAAAAGSPYIVFGGDGAVVATGETVGEVLPARESTWGSIKALYR